MRGLTICSALVAMLLCSACASAALMTVGDWQFNDATSGTQPYTAADSSGNGRSLTGPNDGTDLINMVEWTSGDGGGSNGAIDFNRTDHLDNKFLWNGGNITLESAEGRITAKFNYHDNGPLLVFWSRLQSTHRHIVSVRDGGILKFDDGWWGDSQSAITSTTVIPVDVWSTVDIRWGGAIGLQMYVNGGSVYNDPDFVPNGTGNGNIDSLQVGGTSGGHTDNSEIDWVKYEVVPEPGTLCLCLAGCVCSLVRRRQQGPC